MSEDNAGVFLDQLRTDIELSASEFEKKVSQMGHRINTQPGAAALAAPVGAAPTGIGLVLPSAAMTVVPTWAAAAPTGIGLVLPSAAEDMSCKDGDRDGTEEEKQEGYNRQERGWQSRAGIERMETGGGTGERESDDDTPIILCAPKGPDNVQGGRVGGVGGAASHSVDTNAWELEREDQDGDESLRGDGMPGDVVQVEQLVASQDEDDDDLSLTERQARLQRCVLTCVRAHALQCRSALRACWAWDLSNNGV